MKKGLVLLVLLVMIVGCAGCKRPAAPGAQAPTPPPITSTANAATAEGYKFTGPAGFSVPLSNKPTFTPAVKSYTIAKGLKNVANLAHFKADLAPEHLAMIEKNGFVVMPANWKQMEFVYELNNYPREHRPSFVTSDSVLHTMHVFYDYMLRNIEVGALYDRLTNLSVGLLQATSQEYASDLAPELKEAAKLNVAFALVPVKLLEIPQNQWGVTVPADITQIADAELALMQKHEGWGRSLVTDFDLDYSQFVPRGHYTRSDKLKRYFKAMMWYGLAGVPMYDLKPPGQKTTLQPRQSRQAYLLAEHIVYDSYKGEPLGKIWEDIYEPTAFLVGFADDNTPEEFTKAGAEVFGDAQDAKQLIPEQNLVTLAEKLVAMHPAQIIPATILGETKLPGNPQLRVMGQRYILDSYLFQQMVFPFVGTGAEAGANSPGTFNKRTFPMGLDIPSILGSERAYHLADTVYTQTKFKNYAEQTEKLRGEVAAYTDTDWTKTVYNGWLHALKLLLEPKGEGYPTFMRNDAWLDKQINCALGSWAELRHDTILYAKQSVVAECGGEGGEQKPPPKPKGYVEPEVLMYWRTGLLMTQLRDGLQARNLLDKEGPLPGKFDDFIALLKSLQDISVKELQNQALTQDEFDVIEYYGDTISKLNMFTSFSEESSEITSAADKDMAVVADVHTGTLAGDDMALEEGVGRAQEIYAVYPMNGKLMMGRGATFSYYEFTVLVKDRMTDEAWQKKIDSTQKPQVPAWVKSFRSSLGHKGKRDVEQKGMPTFSTGGC